MPKASYRWLWRSGFSLVAVLLAAGCGAAAADLPVDLPRGEITLPAPEDYQVRDGAGRDVRRALPGYLARRLGTRWQAVLAAPGAVEAAVGEWHPVRKAEALGLVGVVQALPDGLSGGRFEARRNELESITRRLVDDVSRALMVPVEADPDALLRLFMENPAEVPAKLRDRLLPMTTERPGPGSVLLMMLRSSTSARGGYHAQGLGLCIVSAEASDAGALSVAWSQPVAGMAEFDALRRLLRATARALDPGAGSIP